MKNYHEMAQSALSRVKSIEKEKQKRKKTLAKILLPLLCLALLAALGIGALRLGQKRTPPSPIGGLGSSESTDSPAEETTGGAFSGAREAAPGIDPTEETKPPKPETGTAPSLPPEETRVPMTEPPAPLSTETQKTDPIAPPTPVVRNYVYLWWNGKNVAGYLVRAMEDNPDGVYTVLADFRPTTAEIDSFVHEGKTLSERAVAACEPNASASDIAAYMAAFDAYAESVLSSVIEKVTAQGIECEKKSGQSNCLRLVLTPEQFKNLSLDHPEAWSFTGETEQPEEQSAPGAQPGQIVS